MNLIRSSRIALVVSLAACTAACFAQPAESERGQKMVAELQKRFAAADTNGDGRLTREEAQGKMPFVFKHFDEIDSAHSGSISMADIVAYARSKKAAGK